MTKTNAWKVAVLCVVLFGLISWRLGRVIDKAQQRGQVEAEQNETTLSQNHDAARLTRPPGEGRKQRLAHIQAVKRRLASWRQRADARARLLPNTFRKRVLITRFNIFTLSPDGRLMATDGRKRNQKELKIWDTQTGKFLRGWVAHDSNVNGLTFSSNGKMLASASNDWTAKLWDVSSGRLKQKFYGHQSPVVSVAISPNSQFVATGDRNRTLKVWDAQTGRLRHTIKMHGAGVAVAPIAFSPDNQRVAVGNLTTVHVWDVETGRLIRTMKSDTRREVGTYAGGLAFLNGGKTLAIPTMDYSESSMIGLWDVSSGNLKSLMPGHSSFINTLAATPDGRLLASGSYDDMVRIWNVKNGLPKYKISVSRLTFPLALSHDGRWLAVGSNQRRIELWQLPS